jgi:hypothetical protein
VREWCLGLAAAGLLEMREAPAPDGGQLLQFHAPPLLCAVLLDSSNPAYVGAHAQTVLMQVQHLNSVASF